MTNFRLHRPGQSAVALTGQTLIEAVTINFPELAKHVDHGLYKSGATITEVYARPAAGWPGAEVTIKGHSDYKGEMAGTLHIHATPAELAEIGDRHDFDLAALPRA